METSLIIAITIAAWVIFAYIATSRQRAKAHKQDMLNNKTALNVESSVVMKLAEYVKRLQRYFVDGALLRPVDSNGIDVWLQNTYVNGVYALHTLKLNVSPRYGMTIVSITGNILYTFNADGTTTAFGSEKARKKESGFSFEYILSEIIYNWEKYQNDFQKQIEERVPREKLTSFNIKSLEVSE